MPASHVADHPGLNQAQFAATLIETPGAAHTLTVTGEASGDYRVQQVELVRAHHQTSDITLTLDLKAKLGPVENPHPEFIRLLPLQFTEAPALHRYKHVRIVNGAEHFTINVTDVL
jgi:hypothetical protein